MTWLIRCWENVFSADHDKTALTAFILLVLSFPCWGKMSLSSKRLPHSVSMTGCSEGEIFFKIQKEKWLLITLSMNNTYKKRREKKERKICLDARQFIWIIKPHHSSKATWFSSLWPEEVWYECSDKSNPDNESDSLLRAAFPNVVDIFHGLEYTGPI